MRTMVTARHCDIPEDLRERAEDQVAKIAKTAHRPQRAEVVFDADHGRKVVEIQLYLPRGQVKIATAEAGDFRTALDSAVDKVRNQLVKTRRPPRRSPAS
jgi:ribosomal subunit interface protein